MREVLKSMREVLKSMREFLKSMREVLKSMPEVLKSMPEVLKSVRIDRQAHRSESVSRQSGDWGISGVPFAYPWRT